MDRLTKKEMLIVKFIVAQNSLATLEKELKNYRVSGIELDSVIVVFRYFSIDRNDDEYSIQYLNYCVKNYDNIKNEDYSNPIERAITFRIDADSIETQTIYKTYTVHYITIPSLKDDVCKEITGNRFWDYEPDGEIMDYGDTDIDSLMYNDPQISDGDPFIIK
jgi:hypothetical protein